MKFDKTLSQQPSPPSLLKPALIIGAATLTALLASPDVWAVPVPKEGAPFYETYDFIAKNVTGGVGGYIATGAAAAGTVVAFIKNAWMPTIVGAAATGTVANLDGVIVSLGTLF